MEKTPKRVKKILTVRSLKGLIHKLGRFLPLEHVEILCVQSERDILDIQRIEDVGLIILELTGTGDASEAVEEVCCTIRNHRTIHAIPILLICEKSDVAIAKCHACQATTYVTSPVDVQVLLQKIFKLLYPVTRSHLRVVLKVLVKGEAQKNYFFANSKDISVSGMLIECNKPFHKGEKVKCLFFLESNQIKVTAEIMRVIKRQPDLIDYGLKFLNIDTASEAIIDRFVNNVSKNLRSTDIISLKK